MTTNRALPDIKINLHKKQGLVFQSDATEILYGGAAGGGKSFLMRVAAIVWAMQIPGLQVYLFRRQFPDLEKNHMEGPTSFPMLLAELIDQKWVRWNKSKYRFHFWNGSTIHLCHCQKDDDRFNYLGAEIHVLLIDELSQFSPVVYKFLRTRVRMAGISLPEKFKGKFPKIVCGSNPGGPCHQYMKSAWIDPAPAMELHRAPESEGGMVRQFIPALISDNPTLMKEDPTYPDRIRGMGNEQLVKAYLDGDFSVVIGGMFDDLWNPSIHVLKPFLLPDSWYKDRSFDWGSSKPFSVGFWAETNDESVILADGRRRSFYPGTLIQIGEWYGWNGQPDTGLKYTASKIAKGIKAIERSVSFAINPGPADTQIFDDQGNDNCIAEDMLLEGIDWLEADKSPGSRKLGWEEVRSRLEASMKYPMEAPGLFFFENCHHSIRTLPTLPRGDNDPEEIAKKVEDHAPDMIRYRVRHESMVAKNSSFRPF